MFTIERSWLKQGPVQNTLLILITVPYTDQPTICTIPPTPLLVVAQGSLYLSGNGFPERTAVRNLGDAAANDSSVVVVEKCQTRHDEHLQSRNVDLCEGLQREYDKTDYSDLMNTTFALVPAGRSPATYRLGEALSAGAIPVFIHQNFVKPFPGKIPWSTFSFSFPAEEAPRIIDTLRAVPVEKLAKMQVNKEMHFCVLAVWDTA